MSLFNLIWIAIFLYFGYNLTFVGFEGINFNSWDEIVGIFMLICAAAGLFCVIKSAIDNILGVTGRFKERTAYRAAKKKLKAQAENAEKTPDKFYEDFRADIVSSGVQSTGKTEPEPVKEEPVAAVQSEKTVESEPVYAAAGVKAPVEDPVQESLRKLREQYEIEDI